MRFEGSITISRPMARFLREICEKPPGRARVSPDERAWMRMVTFGNGMCADINVVATNDPDRSPCWCEAILYRLTEGDLTELAHTEPADGPPFGEWILTDGDDEYVAHVIEEES